MEDIENDQKELDESWIEELENRDDDMADDWADLGMNELKGMDEAFPDWRWNID